MSRYSDFLRLNPAAEKNIIVPDVADYIMKRYAGQIADWNLILQENEPSDKQLSSALQIPFLQATPRIENNDFLGYDYYIESKIQYTLRLNRAIKDWQTKRAYLYAGNFTPFLLAPKMMRNDIPPGYYREAYPDGFFCLWQLYRSERYKICGTKRFVLSI